MREQKLRHSLGRPSRSDFVQFKFVKPGLYICDFVYPHTSGNGITSDRNYELQFSYWHPETAEEYGHSENEIDNIRLMEKESQDAVLRYDVDERFMPTKDLQGFLERDYG